jgi:hypothetical protein
MTDSLKPWEIYEQAARSVVSDLRQHLAVADVEDKQEILGASGTAWEIDGKAVLSGGAGFLVIEARRHTTSGQKQEAVAAFAYRIGDLGGSGGIVVSPLPLQSGAAVIAAHENIHHLQLAEWSTAENYLAQFMGRAFHRVTEHAEVSFSERLEVTVIRGGKVIDRGP